ncbi:MULTISPECIES: YcaO-like family protein [Halobacterium]|uniref:YcaO-like family protein n=1 Tax=Halobacterium TaxID=2239 RepID=UPI00073E7AFE|nr:YcaO-like family protein [Halobacterium sp. CBA1132]MCG1003478.1 YcaO-like family protein [Halobacterium noricense]
MTVAVVGDGPAVEAVRDALGDVDAAVESTDVAGVADAEFAVVVGVAGSGGFGTANEHARSGDTPLLTVEVGGLGGRPLADIDAGVSLLGPEGPCFECLAARVTATGHEPAESPSADRSAVRLAGAHAGRLAVDALRGNASPGTVLELPHAERTLAPVPNCSCADDGASGDLSLDDDDRSLDDALAAAEPLVDDRVGVLSAVGERESFPAPYYLAVGTDTSPFSDAEASTQSAGVASDWNAAYMKAVGEGFERYAAGVYREADFETASADHEDAVSPSRFVRPDDASDEPDEIEWVRGQTLDSGDSALLPADRVVFPPPEDRPGTITTGLGLGNSGVGAVLSGLYETVERDATMLSWYSTFDPLGLQVEDSEFDELERRASAENLDVTALLCTQDVDVPVVAVAVHRDEWPRFALGSAADLDADAAARDALCEALQNWMELRAMGPEQAAGEDGAIGKYADFPRDVRGFVDPETTIPAGDVGPDEAPEGRAELDAVLDALADADLDAYAARLTTRDLADAGFEAVRVLVPEAQPLFVDEAFFGERSREVPRELGFQARLDKPFHPFP